MKILNLRIFFYVFSGENICLLLHGFCFFVVTNGEKKQSDIHYSWSGDHIIFIIISLTTVTDGCYRNRSVSKYLQQHLLDVSHDNFQNIFLPQIPKIPFLTFRGSFLEKLEMFNNYVGYKL